MRIVVVINGKAEQARLEESHAQRKSEARASLARWVLAALLATIWAALYLAGN